MERERVGLLANLLYEMAQNLGFDFQKSDILAASYYPELYAQTDIDQRTIRKGLVEVLTAKRAIPVLVYPATPQPVANPPQSGQNPPAP